jgi:hypothetical protein
VSRKNTVREIGTLRFLRTNNFFLFIATYLSLGEASMKAGQAEGEALSPQKRTSTTSKHKISSVLSIFVGNFWIPLSNRIQPSKQINADPKPQHYFLMRLSMH